MESIGVSANSVDPDQTAPVAQSGHSLHCLPLCHQLLGHHQIVNSISLNFRKKKRSKAKMAIYLDEIR